MDNVTHTMAGLLVAELVIQLRDRSGRVPTSSFRRGAYLVSGLFNNLPDADFVYANITEPDKLGYLLHHRGHTHTVLVGLAMTALILLGIHIGASEFRRRLAPGEWPALIGLGLLGPLLHLGMDYSNNYGVHPLWPLDSRWVYGDFIFIIEPLFLAIGIPVLFFSMASPVARTVAGLLLLALLGLVWGIDFISVGVATSVSLLAGVATWLSWRLTARRRVGVAGLALLLVASVFWATRGQVEQMARVKLGAGGTLHDVVLTPSPANPLCWSAVVVEADRGEYRARRGVIAPLPWLVRAQECRVPFGGGSTTAPLGSESAAAVSPPDPELREEGLYRASIEELRGLADRCDVAAFLRFARVPFWEQAREHLLVGDLRFDRSVDLEFSELSLPFPVRCPKWVPGWAPPRTEMLTGASAAPAGK